MTTKLSLMKHFISYSSQVKESIVGAAKSVKKDANRATAAASDRTFENPLNKAAKTAHDAKESAADSAKRAAANAKESFSEQTGSITEKVGKMAETVVGKGKKVIKKRKVNLYHPCL